MRRKSITANYARIDNFGDKLTPELVPLLAGLDVIWAPARRAALIGCGSIMTTGRGRKRVPDGYRGFVLGTGCMFPGRGANLKRAKVISLRGPLTAQQCGLDSRKTPFGDIGLLAHLLDEGAEGEGHLLLPHRVDKDMARRYPNLEVVSLEGDPAAVVRKVRGAKSVTTSSLHGLILADALGIPRCLEQHGSVLGKGFKFQDYGLSIGHEIIPCTFQSPPPARIEAMQARLLADIEAKLRW